MTTGKLIRLGCLATLVAIAGCNTGTGAEAPKPASTGAVASHAPVASPSRLSTTPPSPVSAFSAVPASPTPTPSAAPAGNSPFARATADRPDDLPVMQIHVMYVLPADATDENLDTDGTLSDAVTRMNQWLALQANDSKLRFDTAQGQLDVTFFRLSATEAQIQATGQPIDTIRNELAAAGFTAGHKVYACFYGGAALAGGPMGHGGGGYAALYMKNDAGYRFMPKFGPSSFEALMLHEIMHALGFVASCAPHADSQMHVSNDGRDLMAPSWNRSLDKIVLDPDHDDYFGHNRPECRDLAKSPFLDPRPASPQEPLSLNPTATVVP